MRHKKQIEEILTKADVRLNGDRPWDVRVNDERLYSRVLSGGSLALGEAYMDGWWDCEALDQFVDRVFRSRLNEDVSRDWRTILYIIKSKFLNLQSIRRSKKVAKIHYDLDNDLYMSFLDPYNQYTCGYFKDTEDLNEAQEKKLKLICEKLKLTSSDRVLDIGCGWGGFAKYASEHYGCHVTGISISDEQIKYAKEFCKGLPVDIQKCDYRNVVGEFDKVVVVGMIEHVGYKNYRKIMKIVSEHLKKDGLFLLHTIGANVSTTVSDPWFHKYIFPNGMLPSIRHVGDAIEDLFVMEDWHNFGSDYDKTLVAWFENFNKAWPRLKEKYDEKFYRMWKYYLLSMAGAFRSRQNNQLWQIVLSPKGVSGGYTSLR